MIWTVLFVFIVVHSRSVDAVPLSTFYLYSSTVGTVIPQNIDDGSSDIITLLTAFPFFGTLQTTAYVNTNGVVSFGAPETAYNAEPFPINSSPMLTPYWGDVDTRGDGAGEIRYLQSNDTTLLSMARNDVLEVYPSFNFFNPTSLLIATWDHVGHYNSLSSFTGLTNTFQCIMITDGTYSFVIFLYADGLIQWSLGAQAGFNAGDDVRSTTIPEPPTEHIINITSTSNIGVLGKYLFRVDDTSITVTPPPPIPVDIVFTTEPGDITLALNVVKQFMCSAYVSEVDTNMTLSWVDTTTGVVPTEDNGFSFYNESLKEGDILYITTVLAYSGSSVPVSYSLACSASVQSVTETIPFTLTVSMEAAILSIEGPSELDVESNLTIICRVNSINSALIYFLHNGELLTFDNNYYNYTGSSSSQLTIHNVEQQNGGLYVCITNSGSAGGSAYAELNVTVKEELSVIDSFTISIDGNETVAQMVMTVISGSLVIFTCNAFGIPEPELTWNVGTGSDYYTMSLVSSDTYHTIQTLSIDSVGLDDNGIYTCIATNRGGTASASTQLDVLVPPEVVSYPIDTEIESGDSIAFTCVAEGTSLETFTWSKDNVTLLGTEPETMINTTYSLTTFSLDSTLNLSNVTLDDEGSYSCTASSAIGSSTISFILTVTEHPLVTDLMLNTTEEDAMIVGESIEIQCTVIGIPTPSVSWSKDGVEIVTTSHTIIQTPVLLPDDSILSVLSIINSDISDDGEYTCTGINHLGSSSLTIELTLAVYPVIESFPSDIVVTITDSTSLTCTASGVPLPSIMWYKLGHGQLVNGADYSISTSDIGTQLSMSVLTIVAAIQGDTGLYNCTAVNDIGSSSVSFHLQVNEPPEITDIVFIVGPEVIVGDLTEIQCTAFGIPAPSIFWEATDDAITSGSNSTGNMSTLTLSIPQVSLSDNGPIVCIADNGIGSSATASLNLTVLFAPELQISSNNLEIVIGNDITLVCSSSGRHLPHISWTTPGPTSDRYVISSTPVNESFLISQFTISNSQSVDTGLYNCTAENSVDNSTGSIFLQVLEPAEIVNHTTDSEVIIADSVTVFCEVKGIYTPTIVWTKDGVAYQNSSGITILENIGINGTVYSALIIYSFTRADSGVYSCSATNSAGSDEASFELTIQVYPVIESFPSDIVVTITDSTSLTCTASGVPLPSIMWYKLGHGQLVNGADYSISTSGIGTQLSMSVLTIVAAIQGDTGLYNCTAVNDIGSSSVSFHLQVNEPPEITDIVFIVGPEVIVGDLTEIQCTAFGIPAPSISWEATDDAITSGSNSTGNMSTLTLSIPQVSISDNGPIVCIADNGIGSSATASLNLTVLFAPELQISSNNLEIVIGNDITLVCSSSGRHLPHISWTTPGPTSDRYVISSTPVNESFLISQFTISNSQSVDTGLYNCTAENSVDNSTGSIFLQVLEPAEIVNHTTDSEVIIADSVTVFCEVKGIYTPTIVWTKDGVAYQNSSGITILENIGINGTVYSALIIDTFTRADSGMYSCSASNSAGSDEASFELTIQEPAMVVVYPEDTVVLAGDSILLTCIGYGIPTPLLHWQRDGINIVEDDSKYFITETTVVVDNTVFVMSSLSLCNSSEVNSGEYSCTANNEIRVPATENFTITIKTIAPVILMYPNDTPVTTHSTVSLACTVFGAPLPSVVWSWNRRNNESINNSVPITIEDTSVIRIGALYLIHSVLNICGFSLYAIGDYSCSAESYAGQTVATTALSLEVPANIAVVPNDTSLYVGQTVTLSCVGYGLPLPTITWSKDHQPLRAPYLMNESEIVTEHVTFLRSTLTLCSLKLPDDGQYSCSSTNNLSTTLENFTINIKVEPQIVIFPNDSIFFAGSTVRLSCTGYGILLPSIVWNRGGFNLDSISVNDSRMEIWDETVVVGEHQFIRSYLQICSTVESDSEVYTCTAMTSERQNGVDFRVEVVSVPATLIKTPESVDIIAEMGTSIVANCIAYGNPAPTITWSLLSTPYSDIVATNTTILTTSTNSSIYTRQFVVNRVGIVYSSLLICPGHHAALTTSHILCSANNGVDAGGNVSSHSFTINVTVEPKVFDDPIHHDGFVTETISLVCRADGIPLPTTIVWLKDDCSLTQYIEHLARFQVTVSHIQGFRSHVPEAIESVLTISESMERDSGSYSCRATNEINTAYLPVEHKVIVNAAPVTVDICSTVAVTLCLNGGTCITRGNSYSCVCRDGWVGTQCDKSEALLSAPVLLSPPQTIFVERFSEKVLDCNVIGNPEPLITWYKDGLEMIGATQKNLIIDEVDLLDRAAYQCTAVNNRGNVTSDTAYVNIRGIAQYMVSVHMRYDDISTVKKWFDVYGEETVMRVDSGNMTSVLCVKFMNTTLEGVWNVFITLQSLGGEELMLTQVTDSLTSLFDRAAEELENELTVKEVVRLDGCVEDITVVVLNSISNDSYLELHWPEQSFGSLVEIGCPCEAATLPLMANRRCAGNFEGVVEWEKPEDSQCHFSDMTKILCDLPDSNKLAVVTNDAEDLGTLEIFLGAVNIKIFSNETDAKNTSRSDNVLATIDHLLSAPSEILRRSQEEFNSSSLILEGLREVIDSYPLLEIPPLKLIAKTFTAIVDFNFDLETFAGTSATFSNTVEASGSGLGNDNEDTGSITSSVTLSGDLVSILNNEPDTRISFVMYTSEGLFSEREEFVIENNLTTLVLGSTAVLEARLSNDAVVSGIEDIVTLVFSKNEVAQENGSMSSCVFWNQSLDEGYGGWSGVGCRLLQENDVMATCTCDHLTSFALIVDTTPSEPSTPEDRGIGSYVYIGSIFSTVFLLLNIMTLLCTRSEWRRAIGVFLLNGCISLILLNLVYIAAGYSSSLSDQSCFGVSVVFHYIFLVAVCSLAGLVLTNLRQKNKKKSSTKSCMTVSAVTLMTLIWCLPGVIVALTVSLSHDAYNNANEFCRPVNSAFHYGLILPWGLVHVPAIVCLLLAPCPCLSNTLREHVRRSWLREYTAIVLTLVLFDVSWGLGLPATHPLHVGNLRFIGQIVFCVANGCIGLVLFIFFSVLSKSVRKTCGISLALKRGRENSDWQKQSGLYKSSKKDEKENSDCENMAVKSDVKAAEEEKPVITFHYDLNEVYGNPAKMTDEEEFAFESETQFS